MNKKQSFFDRVRGGLGSLFKFRDDDYRSESPITTLLTSIGSTLGLSSSPKNNSERYKGIAFAAVSAIADTFAAVPIKLYRRKGEEVDEVPEHPALELLHNPNPFMSFSELLENWAGNYELSGNVFWAFVKDENNKDIILPLRPDLVKVMPNKNGTAVQSYKYQTGKSIKEMPPEAVLHWKTFNPLNPFVGAGVMEAAAWEVDNNLAATVYNKKFFENAARPDIAVVLEAGTVTNEGDKERVKADWSAKFQGLDKAWKPVFLAGEVKDIKNLSLSQKDMEFAKLKELSRDEILAIFRVPKTIVAITDDVNRANAETSDMVFAERTIKPLLRKFVEILNEKYLKRFSGTDQMFFGFDDPTPENRELSLDEDTRLVQAGILSVNEVRQKRGYDDVQGGEVPMVSLNQVPIGSPAEENNPPIKGKDLKSAIKSVIKGEDLAFELRGASIQKQMVKRVSKWFPKIAKVSRDLFTDMEVEVLQNLPKVVKEMDKYEGKIKKTALLDGIKAVALWIKTFKPLMEQIKQEEGGAALLFLGINEVFDLNDQRVQRQISEQLKRMSKVVVRETLIKVERALNTGISQGEGIDQLTRRVSQAFNQMETYRAERIARSEVITASNSAQVEAWHQSGVVTAKIWYTALDERVCEECAALHGEKIGLDDDFIGLGEHFHGIDYDYRSIGEPALHPNCRCTLVPVVSGKRAEGVKPEVSVELVRKIVGEMNEAQEKEINKLRDEVSDALKEEEGTSEG